MRKITIDNKRVIARNAITLGFATQTVKRGAYFVTNEGRMCRSLGRIASCDNDGQDCTGHVVAMVWGPSGHCYERWIDPESISECYSEPPHKIAAFFFAAEIPHDSQTMRRLMEHGTTDERYVDKHVERAESLNR